MMHNLADQSTIIEPVNETSNQGDKLYDALIYGDEERFNTILNEMKLHWGENIKDELLKYSKTKNERYTFLQSACEGRGHFWAVSSLIDAGVDPKETMGPNKDFPPIIQAASRGNVEIVEKLSSHQSIELDAIDCEGSKQTALHIIATKLNDATCPEEKSRYVGCLNSLVSKVERLGSAKCPWIDNQDIFGNTALHYAALSGVEDAVVQLLRIGCKFGIRNSLGKMAIERIKPSTLELCLDSFIKLGTKKDASSNEFSITFNYSLLAPPAMPPSSQPIKQPSDTASPSSNPQPVQQSSHTIIPCSNPNDEAEPNNPSKKKDDKIYPECETLWHLSRSPEHQYLLKHPLIKSFLMLKWRLIRKFYYFNLVVYILFMGFLTAYILLLHSGFDKTTVTSMKCLLGIFGIIVLVRELFQLSIAPMRYFWTLDNYTELAMIGCTIAVMVHSDDPGPIRHLSAVAVLLAWAEGFLLLGRHPKLSIYIEMFYTVSITFLRLLLWYSVLLIGFGFSFFLVLCETKNSASNKPNNCTQPVDEEETPVLNPADCKNLTESKEPPFVNIPVSLLKVLAMMTGELEYGDLPFEAFPIASRFIFLSFLFLIAIVLFNLLNGLAVSDTQDIRNKAEILGYQSQIRLISYLESVFLGDPFHFLVDWPPCDFIRNNCRSCTILHICFNFLHCFASKAVLFNCLPDKIIVYSSTRHKKSYLNCMKCSAESSAISQCESCRDLAGFKLKINTLENDCRRIQEINNQRSKPTEQGSLEEILEKIEQLRTAIIGLQSKRW